MTLAQCCSISKTGYQKLKFLRQTSFLRRSKVFLRRLLSIMPTLSTQLIQWIVNQLRNGVIESKAVCCVIVPASWECKIQTSRVAVQCLQCHVAAFTNHTSVSTVAQLAHVQSENMLQSCFSARLLPLIHAGQDLALSVQATHQLRNMFFLAARVLVTMNCLIKQGNLHS